MYISFIEIWIKALQEVKKSSDSSWFKSRRLTTEQAIAINLLIEKLNKLQHSTRSKLLCNLKEIGNHLAEMQCIVSPHTSPYNKIVQSFSTQYNEIFHEFETTDIRIKEARKRNKENLKKPSSKVKTLATIVRNNYCEKAELMLPIQQKYGFAHGRGQCGGYSLQFLHDFLYDKRTSFGINRNEKSAFNYLTPEAPDLNFLATLTEKIVTLQKHQRDFEDVLPEQPMYSTIRANNTLSSLQEVAQSLVQTIIKLSQQDTARGIKTGYIITLATEGNRHGIAIYRSGQGEYHICDANLGWLRYKSAEDFEKYFPKLLTKEYQKYPFKAYKIISFTTKPSYYNAIKAFFNWLKNIFKSKTADQSPAPKIITPTNKFTPVKSSYCSIAGMLDHDHDKIAEALDRAGKNQEFGIEKYQSIKKTSEDQFAKRMSEQSEKKDRLDLQDKENYYVKRMTSI